MRYLFNQGNEMKVYIRILRIQKLIRKYNIPFLININDFHRDKLHITSELLFESLARFNEQTSIFCHFAFGTEKDLLDGTLFSSEDMYSNFASDISSMAAEGCYFDTAGYYLCIGSEHITQSDFQFVLHEFSFNTYQSEAYPSHILIEFLEDGYEQYSFDEWVLSYYEIIIRLAAMIREKTKGNQV
ncbi:hypothetical protein [Bacillus sp. (in: firmicutes)]|uniref:hypothetical protein n=1 Tax=Bacillus sp. TaxID=1409 RepID=UPI00289C5110|nr:hypothetical protein [Bacillus sp. (in: firmicutes)]